MWFWIFKTVALSILFILGSHYLVKYLKDTFTVRKIKTNDSQIEQYKTILYELNKQNANMNTNSVKQIDTLSKNDIHELETDLSEFLTQLSP